MYKIIQDVSSSFSMFNFRMELYCIYVSFLVFHCRYRTGIRTCSNFKSFRKLLDIVSMAHPAFCALVYTCKEAAIRIHIKLYSSIFPRRCSCYLTAKSLCYELTSVADSKDWKSKFKYFSNCLGCIFFIDACRSP